MIGEAGSGKTYAIVVAAEGWAQAGIELRAAAPTWRAAHVMSDEGLSATTVASLLGQLDRAESEGGEGLPHGSVLLVDEAGMVDSASLARVVSHAERAQTKLVLVGDPEQLGEIEAGGLFRGIAERTEAIHLDEVIRHRHDLDREAAKRIREGEGGDALRLYRSHERVTVAPNAEERREAMVRDWHEAFLRDEDAVMIAKQNAEVRRLNEIAREVRRQADALGAQEFEVGEARFAAGDLVITRVNDREAEVFNRQRWRIAEVNAAEPKVTLEGIDQARAVEVGADYLARTNPHSDAPALEHAYAVTTYSAQGTTVDRAFVAADPSMDKQELYVATSRSCEETYIYATPEIQAQRDEVAPSSPYLREGIPHIAEAAERDRAQLAAHDEALRSKFSGMPNEELVARRDELRAAAGREESMEGQRSNLQKRIERAREQIEGFEAEREAAQALTRPERREELARIDSWEARSRRITRPARSRAAREARRRGRRAARADGRRSGPRPAARACDHRRPHIPAPLHQGRAGGETERPGQAQGVGPRRRPDRVLPPGPRHQGPEQGPWAGGKERSRASAAGGDEAAAHGASAGPCSEQTHRSRTSAHQRAQAPSLTRPTGD